MFQKLSCYIFIFIILAVPGAIAKDNVLGLDTTNSFNIYISNGTAGVTAIKNVNIDGVREINGVMFLVIRDKGFNAKATEGIVRLDSVQAVLPTLRALNVQTFIGDIK